MKITVCATGDSILMNPLPKDYKSFDSLSKIIKSADVRINNLEMVLSNYDCFASTFCGGTWLNGRPEMLAELLKFGFNYFSIANNHTLDYSYGGLASTIRNLKEKGVAYSGAGMNLEEAARPAVLDTCKGKVALISLSATNDDAARAGEAGEVIPGRPGLNPLRHSEVYLVNSDHMKALKEIAEKTFINGRINNSKKGGYTLEKPGIFSLGTIDFKESKEEGKRSYPNPVDMERTKKVIGQSLKSADYVMVLVHSHEIKHLTDDEPDYFLEEFCHSCIDWGASAVIGSGTHQLKAVEIYKGCPVFYSLGNFIFQSDSSEYLPPDYYEKYSVPREYSATQALAVRSKNGTRGLHSDFRNFRGLMPVMELEGGKLNKLLLIPLELGYNLPEHLQGYPAPADKEVSREVFERLEALSKPYGTRLELKDGLIEVVF